MTPVYLDYLEVLTQVFKTIYTATLGPVTAAFLSALWAQFVEFFQSFILDVLFRILNFMLRVVAILDQMIAVFSGLGTYTFDGKAQNEGLFDFFFKQEGIGRVLAMITILAVVLAVIFTAYSTGKAISDSVLDPDYKPVSKVLAEAFKTAMTFAATPVLCLLILHLSTAVLTQIDHATSSLIFEQTTENSGLSLENGSEEYMKFRSAQPGIADVMFQIFSQDAVTDQKGALDICSEKNAFQNTANVKKSFDIKKISYFTGFLASGFIIVILLLTTLGFVVRMFEILLLYMTAPLFVATIPLDGGGRYRKWREMFIAKLAGAYGPIFTMKLFLILMPLLTSSKLQFSANTSIDWLMKLLLLCGEIYAVYKGRHMIVEIFSQEASMSMHYSEGLMRGVARTGMHIAGAAMTGGTSAAGSAAAGAAGKAMAGSTDSQNQNQGQGSMGSSPGSDQTFRG